MLVMVFSNFSYVLVTENCMGS